MNQSPLRSTWFPSPGVGSMCAAGRSRGNGETMCGLGIKPTHSSLPVPLSPSPWVLPLAWVRSLTEGGGGPWQPAGALCVTCGSFPVSVFLCGRVGFSGALPTWASYLAETLTAGLKMRKWRCVCARGPSSFCLFTLPASFNHLLGGEFEGALSGPGRRWKLLSGLHPA